MIFATRHIRESRIEKRRGGTRGIFYSIGFIVLLLLFFFYQSIV